MDIDRVQGDGGGSSGGSARISRKSAGRDHKPKGFWRVVLLLGLAAGALAQTRYAAVDIGTLGGMSTTAHGINASGQIVGETTTSAGLQSAFLYSGGTMIDLGTLPGGGTPWANGINSSGQVVGYAETSTGGVHAFLYSGGTMIDLGTLPGGGATWAYGINASGQVVGWALTSTGDEHAFLYSGGTMTDLGTLLGGWASWAYGINDSGQVVGTMTGSGAFLYSRGTMIDLGTLVASAAYGINASGQVVGDSGTSTGAIDAFLSSGGTMIDLGALGGNGSMADGINAGGQVVGWAYTSTGDKHAFLSNGGPPMTDLNERVTLPAGVYLVEATAINDRGQIAANGSDGHAYLLTPASGAGVTNPYAPYAKGQLAPQPIDVTTALNAPAASSVAADGVSAVVLAFQSTSSQPVQFSVAATIAGLAPGTFGSLSPYDPNFLVNPNPPANSLQQKLEVTDRTCDASGRCAFLALLWGPNTMPVPNNPFVSLNVTAKQQGGGSFETTISLVPPPLLLVHGIWSTPAGAGFTTSSNGFYDWIPILYPYPHRQIFAVDYSAERAKAFTDKDTQAALLRSITNTLASASNSGMAARTVDVVAHSMGGLVTRYFLSNGGPAGNPALLPNPVHKLITIGTPHLGSALATSLYLRQGDTNNGVQAWILCWVFSVSPCTLGGLFASMDRDVNAGGVLSLTPGTLVLNTLNNTVGPSNTFSAIVGQAPSLQVNNPQVPLSAETLLNIIIGAFLPGQTVASILGTTFHDTIVPVSSQAPSGAEDTETIPGIVHTALVDSDKGETASLAVWQQAYWWLTGGTGAAQASASAVTSRVVRRHALDNTGPTSSPPPVLDLTGYTQVAASNVTLSPATGSVLTINSISNITATSSTKSITEVLLFQSVTDPTDTLLLHATQSPFSIAFTPTRLGSANFGAITVFSDKTYALTQLQYTLQPNGNPTSLTLVNAPVASMIVGTSTTVRSTAEFAGGPVDVTQEAKYTTGSGASNVLQVGVGGTITANGNGEEQLDVSYGGVTASALVNVGACTYSLSPSNQVVPSTGGPVTIQVTAPAGCAWMATGGSTWLTPTNASGTGNGSIGLTAAMNNSGNAQYATIMLGGIVAAVTQSSTACTYGVSPGQINAPAAGVTGTITVTTSCPVVVSSNASWVTADAGASPVSYTVAPNNGASQRTATLTIGTQAVPVVQTGSVIPGLSGSGLNPSSSAPGGPAFTLTVTGTSFASGAVVQWNGAELVTTFVSATQLTAAVPASLIASAGSADITVINPGGASSPTVTFTIQNSTSSPTFGVGGTGSAADLKRALVPGSLAIATGTFGLSAGYSPPGAPFPTSLDGLSLQFTNGVKAPLLYVSASQVDFQVPWELAGQTQSTLTASFNGSTGAETVSLAQFAPGIFSVDGQGSGQGAIVDASYELVNAGNPAIAGTTNIIIYCTGLGPVTNQPATGAAAPANPLATTTITPTLTIGGTAADVTSTSLTPGDVGVYQVLAQVPAGAPTGDAVPVVISIGGATSNTVTMAIRARAVK